MSADTMKGLALFGNRHAEVQSFKKPKPGPGEVLIRVKTAGICGSDLHFYRESEEELGLRRGVVIGHEPAGIVEAVDSRVKFFGPGDRVTVNHTLGCGECGYCEEGSTCLCTENLGIATSGRGGDAEYMVIVEDNVHPLPSELSFTDGSFIACTGATAYGALRKISIVGPGADPAVKLVVFGLGPVGLSVCLLATAAGARVYGVDINEERMIFARQIIPGLRTIPGGDGAVDRIVERVGGRGVDRSVETSGAAPAQRDVIRCLKPRGKAVYVGLQDSGEGVPSIHPAEFLHLEKSLHGSKVLPKMYYDEMIDFMIMHDLHFDAIVTNRIALEGAPDALKAFEAGAVGKFVIEF